VRIYVDSPDRGGAEFLHFSEVRNKSRFKCWLALAVSCSAVKYVQTLMCLLFQLKWNAYKRSWHSTQAHSHGTVLKHTQSWHSAQAHSHGTVTKHTGIPHTQGSPLPIQVDPRASCGEECTDSPADRNPEQTPGLDTVRCLSTHNAEPGTSDAAHVKPTHETSLSSIEP
jgi:hypothetical protein